MNERVGEQGGKWGIFLIYKIKGDNFPWGGRGAKSRRAGGKEWKDVRKGREEQREEETRDFNRCYTLKGGFQKNE